MTDNFEPADKVTSADSCLTRKEFIRKVVKGSAIAGGLLGAPVVLDKFLIPKVYAASSTGCQLGDHTTNSTGDTVIQAGANLRISCSTGTDTNGDNPLYRTPCNSGNDNNLNCLA